MINFFGWHWDTVGFGASLLCALHCMLWPLILPLGLYTGAHWLINPMGEWIFIGVSMAIAIWALQRSFFKEHRNIRPTLIALLGFLGLLLAQLDVVSNKHGFMAIGGGLIAYAHFYNWQLANYKQAQEEKTGRWLNPSKLLMIALIVLYFLGLRSAFQDHNQPLTKDEVLKVVWQRVED